MSSEESFKIALLQELESAHALKFASLQSRLSFFNANELQQLVFKCENEGLIYAKPIHETWDRKTHKVQVEFHITHLGRMWLKERDADGA